MFFSPLLSGLNFTIKHRFSKEVNALHKDFGSSARFIKYCRRYSFIAIIGCMFSVFFLSIKLPVIAAAALLVSLTFLFMTGRLLNHRMELGSQTYFFNLILEKKDEVTYNFYTAHPELDPQQFPTLVDAINASQRDFERDGYLYAHNQLVHAIKLFSLSEDSQACFDVEQGDIIKLRLNKII